MDHYDLVGLLSDLLDLKCHYMILPSQLYVQKLWQWSPKSCGTVAVTWWFVVWKRPAGRAGRTLPHCGREMISDVFFGIFCFDSCGVHGGDMPETCFRLNDLYLLYLHDPSVMKWPGANSG